MKHSSLCLVFVMLFVGASAQYTTGVQFIDFPGSEKSVPEKKAKYKRTTTIGEDSLVTIEVMDLKKEEIVSTKYFKNGLPVGIWTGLNYKGDRKKPMDFDKLKYDLYEEETPIIPPHAGPDSAEVPTPATYGTDEQLYRYLGKNIAYPQEAQDAGTQGMVVLRFNVKVSGELSDITIVHSVDPFLDYEAHRVVSLMDKWTPAELNGEIVESVYHLPIKFTLR